MSVSNVYYSVNYKFTDCCKQTFIGWIYKHCWCRFTENIQLMNNAADNNQQIRNDSKHSFKIIDY